jgi:hypothetical protein
MALVRAESVPSNDGDTRREPPTVAEIWKRVSATADATFSIHQEVVSLRGDTDEAIGRLFAEISQANANTEKIMKHLGLVPSERPIPEPGFRHERHQSFADLEEEITDHGTRILKATESQLHAIVERKIVEVERRRQLEQSDEIVKTAKMYTGRAVFALALSAITATGGLIWAAIRGKFH